MTTTQAACNVLNQAGPEFAVYVAAAIDVVPDVPVDPNPGTSAQRILRFEVMHTDPVCRIAMADACVVLAARDPAVRFVAPTTDMKLNYVSYFHRESAPTPTDHGWRPLSDGETSHTPEVCVLGQTLPDEIGVAAGAGYLHYMPDRPGDGWTIDVGVRHRDGVAALSDLVLAVTVSARPDWTPRTTEQTVVIP